MLDFSLESKSRLVERRLTECMICVLRMRLAGNGGLKYGLCSGPEAANGYVSAKLLDLRGSLASCGPACGVARAGFNNSAVFY